MRLVFLNPHLERFGVNVANWLIRRRSVNKYTYILEEIVKNPDRETAFVVDGNRSSFSTLGLPLSLVSRPLALVEFYIWAWIHGINPFLHKIYRNESELNPEKDIIFTFARASSEREAIEKSLDKYEGVVLVHFTHYFIDTKKVVQKIKALQHPIVCAESNLTRNEYFQYHFPFVEEVYILPFVYTDRFLQRVPVLERKNKCFAIGTYFKSDSPDYLEFYGDKPFHPMRHAIYFSNNKYAQQIDSYITEHTDSGKELRAVGKEDPFWLRTAKQYLPFFLLEKVSPEHHQQKYFSFDIVEKYNEYRMFVSPEEVIGLPSINAVEGMACGSAYIGTDSPMYSDFGIRADEHYIAYEEGSFQSLVDTISYYQEHEGELKEIAERGYTFVRERFSGSAIAQKLWADMVEISNAHQVDEPIRNVINSVNKSLAS